MQRSMRWVYGIFLLPSLVGFSSTQNQDELSVETRAEGELSQAECEAKIGTMFWMQGACRPLPVAQYAPLVYLDKAEQFTPSSVDFFLPHMKTEGVFLATKERLKCPTCKNLPFLYGQMGGNGPAAPVYAIVTQKSEEIVDLTYWFFYPYNLGKTVCLGASIGGRCVGCKKEFGDHVGDWEHITVRTVHLQPTQVYLSWHAWGNTFTYGDTKAMDYVDGTHPIVYSANGSHGVYPKPGKYQYRKLPNGGELADYTSKGRAWRSWKNLDVVLFKPNKVYTGKDAWMNFKGSWGNPKQGCDIYERLSGECQLNGGPSGPVTKGSMTSLELL